MSGNKPKVKEYQTLFWVPMLFQTSAGTQEVITEMLDKIIEFHEDSTDVAPAKRPSVIASGKRRQQILGDNTNTETIVATRVEVVPKSDNSKYVILSVLKVLLLSNISFVSTFTKCEHIFFMLCSCVLLSCRVIFCSVKCTTMSWTMSSMPCKSLPASRGRSSSARESRASCSMF
jgi:hypothetical protein